MKKWILLLCVLLLFMGCATSKEVKYGGYENNFATDSSFAYQYEMVYVWPSSGEKISTYPTDMDIGYLDVRLDEFKCNILIKNLKIPYRVWSYAKLYDICTNELFFEYKSREYKNDKKLPEEKVLEVKLPFDLTKWENVEVCFHVEVLNSNGGVIYKTEKVSYKVE